jgi:hypothetical protein
MRSLTLQLLVIILLSGACDARWLGVPILPDGLSGSSAPLLLADWIIEQHRMIEPQNIELWLIIAGAAWLMLSAVKQMEEFAWSRPRGTAKRIAKRPEVAQPLTHLAAKELIPEMTHEEWRARVFSKRPTPLPQMSTVDYASKTG